ncbi:early growth response factor homolog 1-like [Mytilus trossulus]|uniref:early growth response factor homolog 1-like n=1 Tax=Mytilus trossulus TaxID=6551 RepID=UPI003007A497
MDADLVDVKQMFSDMMRRVQPWTLSHFIMWLDLKIAEYKVLGYMVLDKKSAYDKDQATVYRQTSRINTSSPLSESSSEQIYDLPIQGKQTKQNRSPNMTNDYMETENYTKPAQGSKQKSVTNAGMNERTDNSWQFRKQKSQNQECERQISVSGNQESCENKSVDNKIQNQRKPRKPGKVLHSIVNNLKQNSINNPVVGDSGPDLCKTGNQKNDISEREVYPSYKTRDSPSLQGKYQYNGINTQNNQVMSSLTRRQELTSGPIQDDRSLNRNTEISASQESEDSAPLYKSQQFSSLISLSRSRGRRRRSSNEEITYPLIKTKDTEITQPYDEPPRAQNLADFYFAQNQLDEQFAVRRAQQSVCKKTSKYYENEDPPSNNQSEQNQNIKGLTPSKCDNGSKILKNVSVKQEVVSPVRSEVNSPRNPDIEREKTPNSLESSLSKQFIDDRSHNSMSNTGNEMVVNGNNSPVVVKSEPQNDEEYSSSTGNYYNQSYSSDGDTTNYKDTSTHFEYHGDDIAEESYMQDNSELYGEDSSNDVLQGSAGMDQHDNKIMRQRSYKKRQSESLPNQVPRDASSGKFVCELCSKTFTNRSSYFRHKRIHGEKKYRCFVCDKAFHRKEHFQSHIHRHTKSFPLKCCKCSYESHSLDEANTHFQDSHSHLETESSN